MTNLSHTEKEVEEIAAGLTAKQVDYVKWLLPNERKMGGYWPDCGVPGLITNNGINHPIFGSHYRLTALGLAVRNHLISTPNMPKGDRA